VKSRRSEEEEEEEEKEENFKGDETEGEEK